MKLTTDKNLTELARQQIKRALEGEKLVVVMRDRLCLASFASLEAISAVLTTACTTAKEADEAIRETFATFVIADDVPEAGSGMALLKAHKHLKTMCLTERENEETVKEAEEAGVDALVFRSQIGMDGSGSFMAGIKAVASGGVYLPQSVRRQAGEAEPEMLELIATLTSKEREVLSGVGRGLDNQQIAEELFVADETVKSHLRVVRDKLGEKDRVRLALIAIRAGA